MKLYADIPVQRFRQIVADIAAVCWIAFSVYIGVTLHRLVMDLATPGRKLADAGRHLHDGLTSAGQKVADVPLIPDGVRKPFDSAGGAGTALQEAGTAQASAVAHLAMFAGVAAAVVPIMLMLALWLPPRVRFARRAGSARRLIGAAPNLDLFALRALTHQPLRALARIDDDLIGRWRDRDDEVVYELAVLELRSCGVRPPPREG
ncbi:MULTISPECIES: hypothetical protein [unclassified Gordonia (in: high G+C Gram-positive bacteria)]